MKSDTLSASVPQYPTCAVSDGRSTAQNAAGVASRLGAASIGPKPPAADTAHAISASARATRTGAEYFSTALMQAMPRVMTAT